MFLFVNFLLEFPMVSDLDLIAVKLKQEVGLFTLQWSYLILYDFVTEDG